MRQILDKLREAWNGTLNRSTPLSSRLANLTIVVYSMSQWTLMSKLCRQLGQEKEFNTSVVYFGSIDAVATKISDDAAEMAAKFINFDAIVNTIQDISLESKRRNSNIDKLLAPSHPYRMLLRRQLRAAHMILEELQTDVLIVVEDGPGGNAALLVTAGAKNIPTLVVPYGIGESKDYDVFLADKYREGALNFVPDDPAGAYIRKHAPHWIRSSEYGDVFLFPAEFVLARLAEGLDLPRPWAVHGGIADKIAVESAAMREIYIRECTPNEKLVDLGTLYCDVIRDALDVAPDYMRAFETCEKIRPGRTSILVALPPSYHNTRGQFSEFQTYEELCFSLIRYCCELPNTDVTVSVHPNTLPEHVALFRDIGARITDSWIVSLIPQHDLFLTDFSSTIRWAIAARKPVINYDIYKFDLDTYRNVDGVITLDSFDDVCQTVSMLVNDPSVYRTFSEKQRLVSEDWGVLDGQHFQRLCTYLRKIIKHS